MKKNIITFVVIFCTQISFAAGPAPDYLRGGTITVTLKDGTIYKYSTDEYAVVRRGPKAKIIKKTPKITPAPASSAQISEPHKNIISIGVVRSRRGFHISEGSSYVEVVSKKEIGGQLQYQRRVSDKVYLGGQIDTNQGFGLSVGLGLD